MKHYDFAGYATKFNVQCTDGRVIRDSAFDDQLPCTVPLVWQHDHDRPENCIGHADLEARPDGVYAYCSFTEGKGISPAVPHAKALVAHGDVDSLSIFANQLTERSKNVVHGVIKEVSLVLAGANPGAKIREYDLCHSDGGNGYSAAIYAGADSEFTVNMDNDGYFAHADEPDEEKEMANEKKTVQDALDSMDDDQKAAVVYLLNQQKKKLTGKSDDEDEEEEEPKKAAPEDEEDEKENTNMVKHSDTEPDSKTSGKEKTVGDVLNTLNDEQKAAVMYIIDQIKKNGGKKQPAPENTSSEEDTEMKHNAFEDRAYTGAEMNAKSLSHSDEKVIWKRFMNGEYKTLKQGILSYAKENNYIAHADTVDTSTSTSDYGFENIEWLFPDAKVLSDEPMVIDRRQEWVKAFMDKTTHLPVSRVKTIYADITADDARAKGYAVKGRLKTPEVVKLLKHVTQPTTIFKMQKFDKDDLRDITSFDPLKWIDAEMTGKLHEEIARAALIGDGREDTDEHKIDEECIVPIMNANDLFCIKSQITVAADATDAEIAEEAMDQAVRAKKDYKGSGDVTLFTTEDWLSEMYLLKDLNGRRVFESEQAICNYMRVQHVQTVELMEGVTRTDSTGTAHEVFGIIVNPKDYAFGSDSGSAIETFKQFDIDYNQEKILKEVRCSGNLRVPYSAIVLEIVKKSA